MNLVQDLRRIVGRRHVLTAERDTRRYCEGYRFGRGRALAVVRPGSLVEQWRVVEAAVAADVILIFQAANTGLTGGSSPNGDYDRPVVVVSTGRIKGLHLIDGGRQVVCLPGVTLHELERALKPLGREPHSVIGSSCLGASVHGGICNNSGGSLVKRGPAYTELALYARVDADGRLSLVNHLGIELGNDPETILGRLERGELGAIGHDHSRAASDRDYADHVRDVSADTPARFNADPRRLFEASGSAGRVALFAVRLDTFAAETGTTTFYIGTNDPGELTTLRRRLLTELDELPIAGEYIHRDAFDLAERYGRDTFLAIRRLGTDRLPMLFAAKAWLDARTARFARPGLADRLLQRLGRLFPPHLPARMTGFRDRFEHHLILKVADGLVGPARALLGELFPSASGALFECTPAEAEAAFLHRFAVAGAAVRYRAVHAEEVEDLVALDIALPRSTTDWVEELPEDVAAPMLHRLYYGHFLCHVFHQDYIVARGRDPIALEHRMLELLDARGARYPAEHNVGHLYSAPPEMRQFYRQLDPQNRFNPGIGHTSKRKGWEETV